MSAELSRTVRRPLSVGWTSRFAHAVPAILWMTLIGVSTLWGAALVRADPSISLGAPPLFGRFDPRASWTILFPLALAGAAVWAGARVARAISWRALLVVSTLAAALWALSLAVLDGGAALTAPLTSSHDYLVQVGHVDSLSDFLAHFTDRLPTMSVHVQGHPPGMVILLWLMARVGMAGATWATIVVIAVACSGVAAVLVAVRALSDEDHARAVAPFVAFAPFAVWVATSADAFFMGIAAWAVVLAVVAARSQGHHAPIAAAGGVVFGCALLLSYGLVLLGLVVVAIAFALRRWRWLAWYGVGAAVPIAAMWLAGFDWWDGLLATRERYLAGVSSQRPYAFFVIANLGALAVATGPAVARGLATLRHRGLAWLVAGGAAAIVVADSSAMSKGEVERIWLPFALWLLVSTVVPASGRRQKWWLAAQCATGLAVQILVVTPW